MAKKSNLGPDHDRIPGLADETVPTFKTQVQIEWAKIGPGGRVVIPAAMRRVLGIAVGDPVQLRLVGEELRIVPKDVAVRRVQELVATYAPDDGRSWVDALIEDRERDAEAEDRGE